jgi:hypothetical protein
VREREAAQSARDRRHGLCGAVANAASTVVAAALLLQPVAAADRATGRNDPPVVLANPLARQSVEQLTATRTRPLFAPSRALPPREPPPLAQISAQAPPPPPPPGVVLLGIVKADDAIHAVLRSGSETKTIQVQVGDKVGGWTVAEIRDRHLVLALGDQTFSVALFKDKEASGLHQPGAAARKVAREQ